MKVRIDAATLDAVRVELARRRLDALKASPAAFRDNLLIDNDGAYVPLGKVMAPYQRADFEAMDAAWMRIAGVEIPQSVRDLNWRNGRDVKQAYLERPRGHSKTTDQAASALWVIWASKRKLNGFAVAAARDQAALLANQADTIVRANPWIGDTVTVGKNAIVNEATGSTCKIMSSDAGTAYGATPDFVIVDELTHWTSEALWSATFSGSAKRSQCVVIVISNAGYGVGTSWHWKAREAARTGEGWYFNSLSGPIAPWITEEKLAEQRHAMTPIEYRRLWLNLWVEGTASALNMDDVHGCVTMPRQLLANPYFTAVGGLDLGISHDHAAFVVLGIDLHRGRFVLLTVMSWNPADFPDHKISLKVVERDVVDACNAYGVCGVAYDPFQAEYMAENLRECRIPTYKMDFTPKNMHAMAKALMDSTRNRDLEMYQDDKLLADLGRLQVLERGIGYKLEAPRDANGHCDRATALVIALPYAIATLTDYGGKRGGDAA